jgi:transaldolase
MFNHLNIRTNVTLVFTPNQVLLAAKAGATLISPFVGRLVDSGEDGLKMIEESVKILDNYDFKAELLVASVRDTETVKKSAVLGANIATVPFKILKELFNHPLTDAGIEKFLADWKTVRH